MARQPLHPYRRRNRLVDGRLRLVSHFFLELTCLIKSSLNFDFAIGRNAFGFNVLTIQKEREKIYKQTERKEKERKREITKKQI